MDYKSAEKRIVAALIKEARAFAELSEKDKSESRSSRSDYPYYPCVKNIRMLIRQLDGLDVDEV